MELTAIPDYQDLLEQIFLVPTRCVGIQTQRAALCTAGADIPHSHAARGNESNMYLGYFAAEENIEGDNPPIGIILTKNKDELLVEYATYEMNSQLFIQKYQLYLPDRETLRHELEMTLREAEQ